MIFEGGRDLFIYLNLTSLLSKRINSASLCGVTNVGAVQTK